MSPRDQKLAGVIVVLLLLSFFIVYKTIASQQVHVTKVLNTTPGSSPKAQWMKEHDNGNSPDPAAAPADAGAGKGAGKSAPGSEGE